MKKVISLILSAVMLLALVPAVIAAPVVDNVGNVAAGYTPTGTAIDDWSKLTDAAGAYYLTKDITVDTTFATAFTGTLDGNGHTVTVSVPMFAEFNGTVKNVVLAGSVDSTGTASHCGVLAIKTTGTAVIDNAKNTATVKGYLTNIDNGEGKLSIRTGASGFIGHITGEPDVTITNSANTADINGYCVSGFIGYGNSATAVVTIKNCVNTGKLTATGAVKAEGGNNAAAGGFFGMTDYLASFTIDNCVNNGEISLGDVAVNAPVGGLIGYIYGNKNFSATITITNCKNTANITGGNQVGGLAGQLNGLTVIENCENTGSIVSTGNYAAGIVSRIGDGNTDGKKDVVRLTVKNTVNKGNVKSGNQYAAGIAAYNPWAAYAENCENYGKLDATASTSAAHAGGIFGLVGYNNTMKYCVNYGEVLGATTDGNWSAGGIVGRSSNSGGKTVLQYCGNFGDVTSQSNKVNFGPSGVAGYLWGGSEVIGCFNAGKITALGAATFATGICTYVNNKNTVFKNNFNVGEIVVPEGSTGIAAGLWYNKSKDATAEAVSDNYCLEGVVGYMEDATPVEGTLDGAVIKVSAAVFASGEVAYELNTAIGEQVFMQTIGKDAAPNFTGKLVIKDGDSYINPAPAPTGDSTVAIVLALIAVSAGAVLTMKKKVR